MYYCTNHIMSCLYDGGHGLMKCTLSLRLTAPCRAYAVLPISVAIWDVHPFWKHFDENSLHRVRSNRSGNSPFVTKVTRTWSGESQWRGCKSSLVTDITKWHKNGKDSIFLSIWNLRNLKFEKPTISFVWKITWPDSITLPHCGMFHCGLVYLLYD